MRYITTADGQAYDDVQDPSELITRIRAGDSSKKAITNDEEYMRVMRHRMKITAGEELRIDTAENFVADLIRIGFLKTEDD
jgi:hypothetical protein